MIEYFCGTKKLDVTKLKGRVFLHCDEERHKYQHGAPLGKDYFTVVVRRAAGWLGYKDVTKFSGMFFFGKIDKRKRKITHIGEF